MMVAAFNILSRPWVLIVLTLGIWALDTLIGMPVFLGAVAFAVVGIGTAGIIHIWKKPEQKHEE